MNIWIVRARERNTKTPSLAHRSAVISNLTRIQLPATGRLDLFSKQQAALLTRPRSRAANAAYLIKVTQSSPGIISSERYVIDGSSIYRSILVCCAYVSISNELKQSIGVQLCCVATCICFGADLEPCDTM